MMKRRLPLSCGRQHETSVTLIRDVFTRWEVGGRVSGRLKPDVKVAIAGDRPPRLGGDVVTFKDMREFLVAYLEYEQQMHVAKEHGGDRVLARRRELVDSATQMMFASGGGGLWEMTLIKQVGSSPIGK